jgi:hypothetical protein
MKSIKFFDVPDHVTNNLKFVIWLIKVIVLKTKIRMIIDYSNNDDDYDA